MKHKQTLAMLLAAAMVLSMPLGAYADEMKPVQDEQAMMELYGTPDYEAPVLHSISVDKETVQQGESLTFTLNVTDDVSGLDYISLALVNETTESTLGNLFEFVEPSETNMYTTQVQIPKNEAAGNLRLDYVEMKDKAGHSITDSNLNHTGIYLYSKGKIMIHLTFDYKTDEKCTTPGQYLKYHRTFQGLSTRELAEKVGIVPATLVLYENDRHPIKHSTAVALANALGIDRNRLLDKYTAFVDYPYSSLLKKVRQDLSLTQIQMAELIGIGQTSYSGWEREIRVPRRKEYDKILAALEKLRVNVDTYLCQSASI